jgi:diacylglycerol kinase (ATP)
MRAQIILNRRSRRGNELGDRVVASLARAGVEAVEKSGPSEAGEFDAIVAAGGDGTVIKTVGLALERGLPFGIVPLGTFNDLARALNVPLDVDGAADVIARGKVRRIDVGKVNSQYFVNEASIGLSTRIARRQTPELKKRFGFFGIAWTVLQVLGHARSFSGEIAFDGAVERFRSVQLTVANNSHFGGVIDVRDASIEDGMLDLFSIEERNPWKLVGLLRKVLAHDAPLPGAAIYRAHAPASPRYGRRRTGRIYAGHL